MENNKYSQELEEMRSQVAILKKKLDKQTIISDTHIRNSMISKRATFSKVILPRSIKTNKNPELQAHCGIFLT